MNQNPQKAQQTRNSHLYSLTNTQHTHRNMFCYRWLNSIMLSGFSRSTVFNYSIPEEEYFILSEFTSRVPGSPNNPSQPEACFHLPFINQRTFIPFGGVGAGACHPYIWSTHQHFAFRHNGKSCQVRAASTLDLWNCSLRFFIFFSIRFISVSKRTYSEKPLNRLNWWLRSLRPKSSSDIDPETSTAKITFVVQILRRPGHLGQNDDSPSCGSEQ